MYRVAVFPFKELNFKGEDGEEFVDVALDVLYAIFLPRPYLRRDIIEDGNVRMALDISGYAEIESRIVHQYDHVGPPVSDVLLAAAHVAEYRRQVEQYRDETHVGQFPIMADHRAAHGRHQVATDKTKFRRGVTLLQRLHEPRSV